MKILMFGRGAIASVYGWALQGAGHDVEVFVRPGRAASYGDTVDLEVRDARRRLRGERVVEQWQVKYRENLEASDSFDLIVVSVSHEKLPAALEYLAPRIGRATVLIFGNVWDEPTHLARDLPASQVVWGFPGAGGGFGDDDVLRIALTPTVIFGDLGTPSDERARLARQAFRKANFRTRERDDFRSWLWIHFILDAGLHSQGVRLGSLSKLIGSRAGFREGLLASRELIPVLAARGVDLRRNRATLRALRAPTWITASALAWASAHVELAHINLAAHSDHEAEEPRAICRDALTEARRWNLDAPRLAAAEPYFLLTGGVAR